MRELNGISLITKLSVISLLVESYGIAPAIKECGIHLLYGVFLLIE